MARVKKRGSTWQIDYTFKGKRIRKSFKTKKEATAELAKRVSLIAEGRYLDIKKECKTQFGELLGKYSEQYREQPSYHAAKRFAIKKFKKYFGAETLISNIRYYDLERFRNQLRETPVHGKKPRADASVNRDMAVLHHIFTKGKEWEFIEENPFDKGKTLRLKENNQRLRFLTEDEIEALLAECKGFIRDIAECALNTGMRRGEILSLQWNQIRNGQIYLTKTKTETPRQIPINDTLSVMLNRRKRRQQLRSPYVFTHKGRNIRSVRTAFGSALRRAGIEDFRFHDLRHTFASQLIMKGGTLKDVQELLGHKTMQMTMRYAHLSQEHKRNAVNLLNGLTGKGMSQNRHKPVFTVKSGTHGSV